MRPAYYVTGAGSHIPCPHFHSAHELMFKFAEDKRIQYTGIEIHKFEKDIVTSKIKTACLARNRTI